MEKIVIYTDGCCLSNPSGKGGFGAVIIRNGQIKEFNCGYKSTTNNRMELMAVYDALMEITDEEAELEFHTDSKYTIGVLSGTMNASKNLDLIDDIKELLKGRKYNFIWVKGHNGDRYNEMCDCLAFSAASGSELFTDAGYEDSFEEINIEDYLKSLAV